MNFSFSTITNNEVDKNNKLDITPIDNFEGSKLIDESSLNDTSIFNNSNSLYVKKKPTNSNNNLSIVSQKEEKIKKPRIMRSNSCSRIQPFTTVITDVINLEELMLLEEKISTTKAVS